MAKYSLTGLRKFVDGFEGEDFHLGIDVHKRSHHVALRRADGRVAAWVSPAEPAAVSEVPGKLAH